MTACQRVEGCVSISAAEAALGLELKMISSRSGVEAAA